MEITKKKVKSLEPMFQKINRDHVRIRKSDRRVNNEVLYLVLDKLLKKMKESNVMFANLKPRLEYMGSYFDGLRVGEPTEYDINVVVKFPIDYTKIELSSEFAPDGYTTIKMPSDFRRLCKIPDFQNTELWCDQYYRLSGKKFRSWMQGVIASALNDLPLINKKRILKIKKNIYTICVKNDEGPANTLTIDGRVLNNPIDIDLVPTFAFRLPNQPRYCKVMFKKVESLRKLEETNRHDVDLYFTVPKQIDDNEYLWRLAFPFQERLFMKGKYNMKSTLKLLKLLRDAERFDDLASYYIKTLFLWEIEAQDELFWKHNSMTYLVFHMLNVLRNSLKLGCIRNYWAPHHNLLEKIKDETLANWYNRMNVICYDINKKAISDRKIVLTYFTVRE